MKRDNVTPDELTFAIKWLIHFSDGSIPSRYFKNKQD